MSKQESAKTCSKCFGVFGDHRYSSVFCDLTNWQRYKPPWERK
jgi:hypothetical protein